jgi:hypothetical protein
MLQYFRGYKIRSTATFNIVLRTYEASAEVSMMGPENEVRSLIHRVIGRPSAFSAELAASEAGKDAINAFEDMSRALG